MSTWYKKVLGDNSVAAVHEEVMNILNKVSIISLAGSSLRNMAVFLMYDSEQDVEVAYFSPSSKKIADMVDAVPCEKPKPDSKENVTVIFGDEKTSLEAFFSDGTNEQGKG